VITLYQANKKIVKVNSSNSILRNEIEKDITLIKKGPKPAIYAINLIGSNNFS
jgi:hypothetical protein